MNKVKKIILLILSITIVAGALFACSKKGDDINGDNVEINLDANKPEEEIVEDKKENGNEDKTQENVNNNSSSDKNEQSSVPQTPVVNNKKDYSLSQIMTEIISVIPQDEHNMSEMPSELYKDMYGIDKTQFEDVLVFGSMMSVKANEIILIKLKNESDASNAVKLLEVRKEQVYKTWEHYLPDQFELVKQAQIKTNGKYVALIIAPYAKDVSGKFMNIK